MLKILDVEKKAKIFIGFFKNIMLTKLHEEKTCEAPKNIVKKTSDNIDL